MARVGRPSKLTPETVEKMTRCLGLGMNYEQSCTYSGIDYTTFRKWMQKGEAAKSGEYFDFFDAIKRAEIDGLHRDLEIIESAGQKGNWTASAWRLERKYPNQFGKQGTDLNLTGKLTISLPGDDDKPDTK